MSGSIIHRLSYTARTHLIFSTGEPCITIATGDCISNLMKTFCRAMKYPSRFKTRRRSLIRSPRNILMSKSCGAKYYRALNIKLVTVHRLYFHLSNLQDSLIQSVKIQKKAVLLFFTLTSLKIHPGVHCHGHWGGVLHGNKVDLLIHGNNRNSLLML